MATQNNTEAASAAPVENGPWSLSWDALAKLAGNYNDAIMSQGNVEQSQQQAANPWELDGPSLAKLTNNKRQLDPNYSPAVQPDIPDQPSTSNTLGGLFAKLINTESGGNHLDSSGNLLTSNKGAKGISQLMPNTAGDPGYGVQPLQNQSESEYIRFGQDYLNAMLKNFGGDERKAVAAYNAGPGAVQRAVAKSLKTGKDFLSFLPNETQKYVGTILG